MTTLSFSKQASAFISRLLLGLLALLAGCATPYDVPVTEFEQPPTERIYVHRVDAGETLYAIAWRYNLDVKQLAARNALLPPYQIVTGQSLRLDMQGRDWVASRNDRRLASNREPAKRVPNKSSTNVSGSNVSGSTGTTSIGKAAQKPVQRRTAPDASTYEVAVSQPARMSAWRWPTQGELLKQARHKEARRQGYRGLDIAGKKGQPIVAANNGVVVYAGSGLKTLGNLLIVEHDNDYLSAYAHNSRLLVERGDIVSAGEKIAELGSSGTYRDYLHFEIRYKGKPVDPLTILPRSASLVAKS